MNESCEFVYSVERFAGARLSETTYNATVRAHIFSTLRDVTFGTLHHYIASNCALIYELNLQTSPSSLQNTQDNVKSLE